MILTSFDLAGRVALVTGASRGLGQGMALGLAEAGADIVGISRGACDVTGSAVSALGRRFMHLPCDLSAASPADLEGLVKATVATFGGLDILVNAAGATIRHPVLEIVIQHRPVLDRAVQRSSANAVKGMPPPSSPFAPPLHIAHLRFHHILSGALARVLVSHPNFEVYKGNYFVRIIE